MKNAYFLVIESSIIISSLNSVVLLFPIGSLQKKEGQQMLSGTDALKLVSSYYRGGLVSSLDPSHNLWEDDV